MAGKFLAFGLIASILGLVLWIVLAMINHRDCGCSSTQWCVWGKCISKFARAR